MSGSSKRVVNSGSPLSSPTSTTGSGRPAFFQLVDGVQLLFHFYKLITNLKTADGLGMLLHQAVRGFELWFGQRPEVTAELRALVEADLTST